MAENKVQIIISAQDQASSNIKVVQAAFSDFTTHITAATFAFNNIKTALDTTLAALQPIVDTTLKFEKIDAIFRTLTGSIGGAASELDFVRSEASRLGLEITSTAEAYGKFAFAAKDSALQGDQARKIFSSVAEASRAMGLSSSETEGALLALSQMMSKGSVQAEELKGQLGERLSGAFNLAAEAMGMSTAELGKQLEKGGLLANDLLPKLADKLHETFGASAVQAAEGGAAAINNFKNAVTESTNELGKLIMPSVSAALNTIAGNFDTITTAAKVLAGAGIAVVLGRMGSAAITAAANQFELITAVRSGTAVMLDNLSVSKAKSQTELLAARSVETHAIAMVEKARIEVLAANATRDAFAQTIRKAQANQALAVAEAELALATNATSLAQARYATAAKAATLSSRAAAGAAAMLSSAMAMVGGPIGLAVMAIAAVTMSLSNVRKEVEEEARQQQEAQEKAAEASRQAIADAKAREDRLVEITGTSTDKQIQDLKRRTEEKLAQLDKDREEEDKAAGYSYAATQKNYAKYAAAKEKLLRDSAAKERKIRNENINEEIGEKKDQLKAAEDYYTAIGDLRGKDRAALDSEYQDKLKAVHNYYNTEMARASETGADVSALEEQKQKAIFDLQLQFSVKRGLLGEEDKKRALEAAVSEGNERIALIEKQIADRVRTEEDGEKEIAAIRADLAQQEYDSALRVFEQISAEYKRGSKEYIEAQKNKEAAFQKLTTAQITQTQKAEEATRRQIEKSSLDYQLELQKRLDWLADSERDGLITHQQAARDKLEAEKNYLAQVAELKRRELADAIPDTVEYKQALAEKYEADRAYAEKRKALEDQINADIIAGQEKAAASAKKAADEEGAAFRALAKGFYAQWDAITNRVIALGPKVAAAFGVSIKDTALKTVDQLQAKLEEVAVSARKAAEAARDIGLFSSLLGEHAKKAEQLAYRYYSQRLAVTELTGQLKQMGLATEWQLRSAASLVKEMDLLNDSDLEDVRGEIDRLTQSLKEAQDQAEDTVNSLRDELDQMLGNKEAIEERDYQAKKDDLLARLAEAQETGNTAIVNDYQEALRLLDELHKRKMANIKEEAEAARKEREKAAAASSSSSSALAPGFAGGGRFPGPDSPVDNLLVRVRSGEWAVNNEAVHFWERNIGRGFMAGINDPLSAAGRQIWERLKAKAGAWKDYIHIPTPKVNFATGGPFDSARGASIFPALAALARAPETPFADAGEGKQVITQRLILQSPSGKQITTDIHGSVKQFLGLLEEAGMRTV